jgi:hypothetical protein
MRSMNMDSNARRNAITALLFLSISFLWLPSALAADAHPDLTGIWTWDTDINKGPGRFDLVWPADPPFTKEGREKVAAYKALVAPKGESPSSYCLGMGMPGSTLASGGYPMEVIQRPEQVTLIQEAHSELRRIFINQPRVPKSDLFPTRNGYSTGRWEGDTLVVETSDLQESVDQGSAHSDAAHVIERFRLGRDAKGRKILTDELTLTDPGFYTQPVTVTKTWIAMKQGGRMLDYECNEPAWEDHLEQLAQQAAKAAVPPKPPAHSGSP